MSVLDRKPLLRWLLPAAVIIAVLGAGAATSAIRASADPTLAPQTPAQLLVDLQTARVTSFSGTLAEHADLGLPTIPGGTGGDGSPQFSSLISGAHTLRVWSDGTAHQRIALIGALGESDVIHNGSDLWVWSSQENKAIHATVPATTGSTAKAFPLPSGGLIPGGLTPGDLTPEGIATFALAALTPTTTITSTGSARVAGRSAYELVISPKDTSSLFGSIRIAIDSARHVPLRVQIYAAGETKPAFEIGYSSVSFSAPNADIFHFNPPPGVQVTQAPTTAPTKPQTTMAKPDVKTLGKGWTTVVSATLPTTEASTGKDSTSPDAILKELPTVSGPWGTGHLLTTKLVTALITTDGHVYVGAVTPAALIATVTAAGK